MFDRWTASMMASLEKNPANGGIPHSARLPISIVT